MDYNPFQSQDDESLKRLLHDLVNTKVRKHLSEADQIALWCLCFIKEREKGNSATYCVNGILRAITGQNIV